MIAKLCPLNALLEGDRHVVAQIVESELVVRSVGHVAGVCLAPLIGAHLVLDAATESPSQRRISPTHSESRRAR